MIRKISLLLRTIKYLKAKQVFYQVYYKLKPKHNLLFYKKTPVAFSDLHFSFQPSSYNNFKGDKTFEFLNLEHYFLNKTDWNFLAYGKLWNYNLQYFNFIHQQNISKEQKEFLLHDIATWLNDGKLILEPYPVSLRAINTIRYISAQQIKDKGIVEVLYAQLHFLHHNPEFHLLGNHLLENAFALLMGGYAFNEKKWCLKAKQILTQELKEQILEDGGHFEQSVMYHQIITFRMLELIDWFRDVQHTDKAFLQMIETLAVKMLDWLKTMSFQNYTIPHFNDSANEVASSAKEIFSFATVLKLPAPKIVALRDSGYRSFSNNNYECTIDAGNITAAYQPGHSHADALSFVLSCNQKPIIVDTGVSTYEHGAVRNRERSTAAHNTVTVNGKNQTEVWESFRVGKRAAVTIIDESSSFIKVAHNGYRQFNAVHTRSFYFDTASIKITDVITNFEKVNAIYYLHLHPDCMIDQKDGNFKVDNTIVSFKGIKNVKLESYKFAAGFNNRIDAKVIIIEFNHSLETFINFV